VGFQTLLLKEDGQNPFLPGFITPGFLPEILGLGFLRLGDHEVFSVSESIGLDR